MILLMCSIVMHCDAAVNTLFVMARTLPQRPSDYCRDAIQRHARALVIIRVYHPDTPNSFVVYEQDASLNQCLIVVIADDLVPHCGHVPAIGRQRRENGWPVLNATVFQCSS